MLLAIVSHLRKFTSTSRVELVKGESCNVNRIDDMRGILRMNI